jgi:hypothetical protein
MWVREGTSKVDSYWEQSACALGFTTSGDDFNVWRWRTGVSGIGHYFADTTDVCTGHDHFVDTDIEMEISHSWEDPSFGNEHASILACVRSGDFMESTVMHEVGHTYGMAHNNTIASLMNEAGPVRGCNAGAYFHSEPDADAHRGGVAHYGRNTDNLVNLSAMIWMGAISGSHTQLNYPDYCGAGLYVQTRLMNYYATPTTSVSFRYALVHEGDNPNSTSAVWSYYSSVPAFASTYFVGRTLYPTVSSMPHGAWYRLWIEVDSSHAISESDEGDNWVPLDVLVRRSWGC